MYMYIHFPYMSSDKQTVAKLSGMQVDEEEDEEVQRKAKVAFKKQEAADAVSLLLLRRLLLFQLSPPLPLSHKSSFKRCEFLPFSFSSSCSHAPSFTKTHQNSTRNRLPPPSLHTRTYTHTHTYTHARVCNGLQLTDLTYVRFSRRHDSIYTLVPCRAHRCAMTHFPHTCANVASFATEDMRK